MLEYVNILQGTESTFELSHGNTLPLVAVPWGMNHWSLQTSEDRWFFHPRSPKLQGIRCTHQPSPWIRDYGAFTLMPQVGPLAIDAQARSSAYRIEDAELSPDYMAFELLRYSTTVEMSPTQRGAVFRCHYPAEGDRRFIVDSLAGDGEVQVFPSHRRILGITRGHSGGVPAGFALYYVIEFDQPFDHAEAFLKDTPCGVLVGQGERAGAYVEFPESVRTLNIRVATSFISQDQAMLNLQREAVRSLEAIRAAASELWETALGRIQLGDCDDEIRRTFYSCLYRCCLFPRAFHELDAAGATVHYSPFSGKVHPGVLYTDTGFWDTYRTLFPLLCLIDRPRMGEMVEGFLNAWREGGWLPQWASPGYKACMIGSHADAVLAHAVACGVRGFSLTDAYAAARKDATQPSDAPQYGRKALALYMEKDFIPEGALHHSVSATLDFAYDDYCVAQLALRVGPSAADDAAKLLQRSQNYRKLWDPSVQFFRARHPDGKWAPFRELAWGGPYVEGGPWQSTWAVPHDPEGLISLMGGREAFVQRLETMLLLPPRFEVGSYPFEIHEMTEMALADFGQYAHSNQPVHHVLYLFAAAGRPDRTRQTTHRVMRELYNSSTRGFPGDEDNGEMSAWYILSALGLFPLCPGDGRYWFGLPLVSDITLRPADSPELRLRSTATVQDPAVTILAAGVPVPTPWLDHSTLTTTGDLQFQPT